MSLKCSRAVFHHTSNSTTCAMHVVCTQFSNCTTLQHSSSTCCSDPYPLGVLSINKSLPRNKSVHDIYLRTSVYTDGCLWCNKLFPLIKAFPTHAEIQFSMQCALSWATSTGDCPVIAHVLLFFPLWNCTLRSSMCKESMFLHVHVVVSERDN